MNYKKVNYLFLIFILLSAEGIKAQVNTDTLRADLEEITIDAAYSPITIGSAPMSLSYKLRSANDITSRPAATMDELTFVLPGVNISNRENYALGERMTIRGLGWRSPFGVRGVQVLLDDMPLTVADGQTIMNMVDPAMVRRIELLRGPSATFWGNSSGGVLYLSTVPDREAPALQYRGYGGSYGTIKQELRFHHSDEKSRIYGYSTFFDTEGYRDHSAARMFRTSLGSEHFLNEQNRVRLYANFTHMPKAQHPGALTEERLDETPKYARENFVGSEAGKRFDQLTGGASYLHEFESGIMDLTLHGTYRDLENPLPFGFIGLERYAGGTRGTYSFQQFPFELDAGAEFKIQQDDRLETDNINGERGDEISVEQTETVTNYALFTRTAVPLSENITLSAGVRADWLKFEAVDALGNDLDGERVFFSINPSAGISYLIDNTQLFANFSTSFESPTTTELVNRPGGGNGFNQNIEPERTIGFETGIRRSNSASPIQYDLTAYWMQVHDLLIPYETEVDGPTFFRNEGNTEHYGIEAAIEISTNQFYSLGLMINALQATFDEGEFDGNDLPGVPSLKSGANLKLRPGSQFFSIDATFMDRYPADSENNHLTDRYLVTDLRWTTQPFSLTEVATIRPFINIGNIFNTTYTTSVNIDAFGGYFYEPGRTRSFQAGLQVNFQ